MSGEHTPEPKPLDAERLAEIESRHKYDCGRDVIGRAVGEQAHCDRTALLQHIAALTAELAERKQQVRELIDADHELTLARRAVSYRPSKWPIPDEDAFRVIRASDRKHAAMAPFSTETSDG